jgi:insulysin
VDFQKFAVVISLTTTGLAKLDQVVEAVYSYIAMLRGGTSGTNGVIPVYILKEVLQLDELQWRFLTPGRPRNYATSLATAMQKYPPEYYVAGPRRLALDNDNDEVVQVVDATPRNGFSSTTQLARTNEQVQEFLSQLTVSNGLITVLSKSFEGMTDRKEEIYGTLYRVRPVSEQALQQWNNPTPAKQLRMDFPRPNPFIPTEIGLRVKVPPSADIRQERASDRTFESRLTPMSPPRKIRQDDKWTVYFKEDDRFGKPKAYVILQILTKQVFATAQRAALSNLLEISIADRLQEYAYDAGLASLSYEVKVLPRGIRLTFGGYNDKLQEFASYISSKLSRTSIRKLLPRNDNEFYRYKDQIMRALSAFDVKQPYFHASYYGQLTLQPRRFQYTNRELLDETRNLVFSDLLLYADSLWTNGGRGEALVQGNVNEREALGIVRSIGDALAFGAVADSEVPPRLEVLPLPPSAADVVPTRMLFIEPNAANENSVGYIMLQCLGKSEKEHVLMELLASIVQEPFYDNLRTKKQLGYIVSSGVRGLANTRTLSFVVQSSVAPSAVLTLKILEFLDSVEAMLEKLTPANLAVYCKSLIEGKTERDKDLSMEVERNWGEISSGRLQFDRLQREAAALIEVDKSELIEFWQRIFTRDGRRALIVEMIPRQGSAASVLPPTTTGYQPGDDNISGLVLGIDDIAQFRRDLEKVLQQSQQLEEQQQQQQQEEELPLPEDELLSPTASS